MKVIGFDQKQHTLKLKRKKAKKPSKLHIKARILLTKLFPCDIIYEEVTLSGSRTSHNGLLRADFFIPSVRLIIETHGKQHYVFNIHFFTDTLEFARAIARDKCKQEWCKLNNIVYISLPYMDNENEWSRKINSR